MLPLGDEVTWGFLSSSSSKRIVLLMYICTLAVSSPSSSSSSSSSWSSCYPAAGSSPLSSSTCQSALSSLNSLFHYSSLSASVSYERNGNSKKQHDLLRIVSCSSRRVSRGASRIFLCCFVIGGSNGATRDVIRQCYWSLGTASHHWWIH